MGPQSTVGRAQRPLEWEPGVPLRTLRALPVLLLIACHGEVQAPERPATVPPDAVWVGGSEAGAFLRIRPVGATEWQVELFNEATGAPLESGRFILRGAPLDEVKPQDATGWDGKKILLRNGGWLERAR